jgi:hypothetical protein
MHFFTKKTAKAPEVDANSTKSTESALAMPKTAVASADEDEYPPKAKVIVIITALMIVQFLGALVSDSQLSYTTARG